ncbi:BTAD domain-containing putative transcriptional regulator [Micromonospora lupini]|uniref:BTAD domain-containing putative transcriptional regulator n=1 Tax=Micromonospora lupini TaxID=285679 RepID=UPI0033EA07D9
MTAPRESLPAGPDAEGSLRLQVLGPLRLWRGDAELDPGPRQQALMLALLLARAGQPISKAQLIDLLWDDDPPVSASSMIHKYVGALRRRLEPGLSLRDAGSYLRRRGDGYFFRSADSGLDLVAFRDLVQAARTALAENQDSLALDRFVDALALWHGPSGHGLGLGFKAASVFLLLDSEFYDVCVAAAELAVRVGQPRRVLPALHLAVSMAPLNEGLHSSLIVSLGAAGLRGEALEAFRSVRIRLAEELGVGPGAALHAAQRQVLANSLEPMAGIDTGAAASTTGLIGRVDELGVLHKAIRSALEGKTAVVIVEGEPGVGKTRLLKEMTADAQAAGALVSWGMCLDGEGTASMWPWVTMVGEFLSGLPRESQATWLAGELGRLVRPSGDLRPLPAPFDNGARFRLFEQVVALVAHVAARRPVVLTVDDLQWADVASLQLFGHLAARLPGGAVLVGALRDRAPVPGTDLSRTLAAVSRVPGHHRILLGSMDEAQVAELVRRETGKDLGRSAAHIHARTAGNPFFVRELSRLLADQGTITATSVLGSGVPSTVRDVVRSRTADLGDDARELLEIAALVGREVGVSLLALAAAVDAQTCLDRIEPVVALGVLEPAPGDPFSLRFPHDLVRESVTEFLSPRRAARLHLRIADALETTEPDPESITERLAHHLWTAGPLADPARTADALLRAGRRAEAKSALEASERQLRSAVQVARAAGLTQLELSAVSLLATVFWRQAGYGESYTALLKRAEQLAHDLGQEAETADFLFMRIVAAFTQLQPEAELLIRRLIDDSETSTDPVLRAYARHINGLMQFELGDAAAALRCMSDDDWTARDDARWRRDNPLRRDLRMFAPMFRGMMLAVTADVEAARATLDEVEDAAGDEPYPISVWAHWAADAAQWMGDPWWCLRITERWRAADPHHFFVNVDAYLRVSHCWARALTGNDAAGAAAEAEEVVATMMLEPPLYGATQYYALTAEMFLAAGMPDRAATALDGADRFAEANGERFAESLRLLVRAKMLHARGEPVAVVRAAAEKAKEISVESGAHMISRRAEELIDRLPA